MSHLRRHLLTLALFCLPALLPAQDSSLYAVDGGLYFSTFQQQVKAKVGDPRGERLVNQTDVGFFVAAVRSVAGPVGAGVFLQYDRGNRHAARFSGFDPATGKTQTAGKTGGDYSEFWAGPLLRVQWRQLFAEGGYGLVAFRTDDARTDLVAMSGDSLSSYSTNPSISWFASVGGAVPLAQQVDAVFRITYRLRYYNERDGSPFAGSIEHGSQNITPFIGVRWRF